MRIIKTTIKLVVLHDADVPGDSPAECEIGLVSNNIDLGIFAGKHTVLSETRVYRPRLAEALQALGPDFPADYFDDKD